ncbi:alkanesulfonate monooxygenase [Hamadaea flava]|uniref:LLM class flavin-dependent oxidoreductase n=1 Tax=Hamadaea flava TaxID=1742688 RepID=A0ABV8LNK6_9ACTN|nr:LLM class flavin-dependent oxidoreductase [Hamadaea flava]MCP2323065.1 alkanesulfonate monooxygenase [Hamadaea flava]
MTTLDIQVLLPTRAEGVRHGFGHLREVVRAAELGTLSGAVVPFDPDGLESWSVAAAALRDTRWLRVAAEFHPGVSTPVYAAKVAASLQRFSGARFAWRLAVDLDPAVARAHGDFTVGDDRYLRAAEFLQIARGVWGGGKASGPGGVKGEFTFEGKFFDVLDGGFAAPLSLVPFPQVQLTGASPAALDLSARHGDVHIFAPPTLAAAAQLTELATAHGRTVQLGVQLSVLLREDAAELADAPFRDEVDFAGTYAEAADLLRAYAAQGVSTVVFDARPRIEETYRVGEHLRPLLENPVLEGV